VEHSELATTTQTSISQEEVELKADTMPTASPEQPDCSLITTQNSTSQELSVTPTPIRVKQATPNITQEEVVVVTETARKRKRGIEEGVIPASDDEDSELSSLESDDEELEAGEKSSGTLDA
jgi:hypothetical protein